MTTVLVLVENLDTYLPILESSGFQLIRAPTAELRAAAIATHGQRISAVVTRGPLGFFAEEMDALPQLRIICVSGAGYEKVDLPAAQARGIVVTNGAGVNAATVADHTLALLLSLVRDIPQADASVRRSEWRKVVRPSLAGKRLGIVGLGAVGLAIARRAAAFDIVIGYHNRKPRSDCDYTWHATAQALAAASDFLVNIARASVVDTQALVSALQHEQIAGAALDVFDDEPTVPDVFKTLGNVVLTPHVAGLSPEASRDSVQMVNDNLLAFFAGQPVLTPVTE
ncbi:hydroxyacid dehydrogenase [Pseudomonas syringae]|uniref:NAD(P)-dependent oxidoreductase n=1 Tax=Pseudomonas syringae TaxID=317 RepID=UPI000BB62423|nr:NAD(P)-dependent oxidoreductase [Pseudomonas syringae]PBP51517.1 hydroxyacid dehydrogenase [Pseudomonas syringae]